MSNGKGSFDRFGRLLASLGKLVLDDRRHLESVCALLQKLVFDATEWPSFKNWKAICELGHLDRLMMLVVGTLDLSRKDEQAKQIVAAFPECFASTQMQGPIPLSVLRDFARKEGTREGSKRGEDLLYTFDACKYFSVPTTGFGTTDEALSLYPDLLGPLPLSIPKNADVGQIVEWQNRKWVVVENNDSPGVDEIFITPAECIDTTA